MEQIMRAARTAWDLMVITLAGFALGAYAVWVAVRGPH
jgi:hypothetical protein